MGAFIKDNKAEIILENTFTRIVISKKDAIVKSAVRLDTNESYLVSEPFKFFTFNSEKFNGTKTADQISESNVAVEKLELEGDVITAYTSEGNVRFQVKVFDRYFTFEILDNLPGSLQWVEFANLVCDYEIEGEKAWGVVGLSMSVNTNPLDRPRIKTRRARARAEKITGDTKGAKFALICAPAKIHRDILKEASETIDPEKGIVLHTCGAWAKDYMPNRKNYTILIGLKKSFVKNAEKYKEIGVEQFDFHHGTYSFLQGNFKPVDYANMAEVKKEFSDPLLEKGIITGLHTYAHYIHPWCTEYLSDPKWQKDLMVLDELTLAEDLTEDATDIFTEESIENVSTDHTFFSKSLPYLLIGDELITFKKSDKKFVSCTRGVCGTKAKVHKKGEKVKHLEGKFNLFAPVPGSDLFFEIARNTAKAYNEGGFGMIYIDALDGMVSHTDRSWYYDALFVNTILKNVKTDPIMEYADNPSSIWAAKGRAGAWDYPWRAYKYFNKIHVRYNRKDWDDCHLVSTMGWYNFYPQVEGVPGNYSCQYQHWDDAEHISSLCLINGYGMVNRGNFLDGRFPAYDRNTKIYLKYKDLLERKYFSEEYLDKLKDLDHEYHLKNKGKDKWIFEEKKFESKRYFSYEDEKRNKNEFSNPFSSQKPFLRLEMGLSAFKDSKDMILLPMDENKQLPETVTHSFGGNLDLSKNRTLKVRVFGNGKKGSKVRISLISRGGLNSRDTSDYVIETDFTGWRDYVLFESHKGENPEFDERYGHFYAVCINELRSREVKHIKIDTIGDIEGVRIGNIYACKPLYDVIKNPKVKVGKTEIMFECEIKSSDFIEWHGDRAEVLDRYGNIRPIYFKGELKVPKGNFKAELSSDGSLNGMTQNAKLTFGFTGKEIK